MSPVIGWLNDDNPLSRRIMEPSFVDLPAGRAIAAAVCSASRPHANKPRTAPGSIDAPTTMPVAVA